MSPPVPLVAPVPISMCCGWMMWPLTRLASAPSALPPGPGAAPGHGQRPGRYLGRRHLAVRRRGHGREEADRGGGGDAVEVDAVQGHVAGRGAREGRARQGRWGGGRARDPLDADQRARLDARGRVPRVADAHHVVALLALGAALHRHVHVGAGGDAHVAASEPCLAVVDAARVGVGHLGPQGLPHVGAHVVAGAHDGGVAAPVVGAFDVGLPGVAGDQLDGGHQESPPAAGASLIQALNSASHLAAMRLYSS